MRAVFLILVDGGASTIVVAYHRPDGWRCDQAGARRRGGGGRRPVVGALAPERRTLHADVDGGTGRGRFASFRREP
jgi:hypothetical protein